MTFAWFVMIGLVIIIALIYVGVIKTDQFSDRQCNLGPDFSCRVEFAGYNLKITLVNELDSNITIQSMTMQECGGEASGTLEAAKSITLTIQECAVPAKGERFKSNVSILYTTDEIDFSYNTTGFMSLKVR